MALTLIIAGCVLGYFLGWFLTSMWFAWLSAKLEHESLDTEDIGMIMCFAVGWPITLPVFMVIVVASEFAPWVATAVRKAGTVKK